MKIYRVELEDGSTTWAESLTGESFTRLKGTWPDFTSTCEAVEPKRFLAPFEPTSIYCIGLNYRAHAMEMGHDMPRYPVLFMKSPSSVCGPYDNIELPRKLNSTKVDYEVELTIIIGKKGKNIPQEEALDYVYGYTVGNDVSARDWQKHAGSGQWVRAKNFDTFCPLGPCVVTADELTNPNNLRLGTHVNGELRQDSNTKDFIFPVEEVISYVSGSTTLLPGTIILTGTPSGVGQGMKPMQFLQPGDTVKCCIENIGTLENRVVEEQL